MIHGIGVMVPNEGEDYGVSKETADEVPSDVPREETAVYLSLKAIIHAIDNIAENINVSELRRVLSTKSVEATPELMDYVCTAAFLSYAGREMNRENLEKTLSSIGLTPNEKLIDVVLALGMKSHLIYIYTFYYLLACGLEPNEKNILRVVEAQGLVGDHERINFLLKFIESTRIR
jgi:ribosomal protein L12E/L44/L45/RPP1/RPP2